MMDIILSGLGAMFLFFFIFVSASVVAYVLKLVFKLIFSLPLLKEVKKYFKTQV